MHIENNSAYTQPLYTRATDKAANANAGQTSTQASSGSQEAATTKAAAVTGVTGSNLSKEVMDQLMKAAQDTGSSDVDAKSKAENLPVAYRHAMEDIVNDPVYASKRAKEWATSPVLLLFRIPPEVMKNMRVNPGPGAATPEENAAFEKYVLGPSRTGTRYPTVNAVQDKLKGVYEASIAQGKSGAQTYAAMLEAQISQPQKYWNALDPYSDQKSIAQGELQVLRQAMAKAASSSPEST